MHINSSLKEHGFTQNEVRLISKEFGLPTWNMKSFACLTSRFSYGHEITPNLLDRALKVESILRDVGIKQYRIRDHAHIARIEVDEKDFELLQDNI